jgi:iron(III) transport system ATP-binding protein
VLILEGLVKHIGDAGVLKGVDASLRAGERVALMGPSGVGKTTLLRIVAGLEKPGRGRVVWNGQVFVDEHHWVPPWKRRVSMVFQDLALWPHLSASEHLEFVLSQARRYGAKERARSAAALLSGLGLADLGARFPSQLSGGQQQRLAIARAVAAEPEILLMDEAFSQLDGALEEQLWALLIDMHREQGWTLVFVTHSRRQAARYADQVLVLDEGRLRPPGTDEGTEPDAGGFDASSAWEKELA